ERAVRKAGHLGDEGGRLAPAAEGVEQREHLGLGGALVAAPVGAAAHAARERRESGCSAEQEDGDASHAASLRRVLGGRMGVSPRTDWCCPGFAFGLLAVGWPTT